LNSENLKGLGLKVTKPRMKILSVFEQSDRRHLSAEDVFEILKKMNDDVPLATIYRVLNQFESAGILKRLNFNQEQYVYELDDGDHHDHLICVKCNKVEEFCDDIIEQRQLEIAKLRGAEIVDHSLCIYVACASCRAMN
jgi:Fur family ferric uptake transcriptional regulator